MCAFGPDNSQALLCEILRFRSALAVQQELEKLCNAHLHASSCDAKGLFPAAVFEGHQHAAKRAAAASSTSLSTVTRTWVHPIIDVRRRATVRTKTTAAERASTGADELYCLTDVQFVQGDVLGLVEPLSRNRQSTENSTAPCAQPAVSQTFSLKELCLFTPEPLYEDALLPALEAIEPHHASKNLLDLWLNKLCGATDKLDSSFNQKRKLAWHLADEATYLFYLARKRLAPQVSLLESQSSNPVAESLTYCDLKLSFNTSDGSVLAALCLPPSSCVLTPKSPLTAVVVDVLWNTELQSNPLRSCVVSEALSGIDSSVTNSNATTTTMDEGENAVRWTHTGTHSTRLVIPIAADAALRLHQRYKQTSSSSSLGSPESSSAFLYSLARLLLRYHALSGGQMEKESGWQAAVPSRVMDTFEDYPVSAPRQETTTQASPPSRTFTIECFASPLNATRRFFFSVFRDTDAAFGSLGNFFGCEDAQQCVDAISAIADAGVSPHNVHPPASSSPSISLLRLECNPPFDHEVITAAIAQLLKWMQAASDSLAVSTLLIIPDSTQARAGEVRLRAEQSPQCRWMRSIPAKNCLYVHGAQHQQQQPSGTESTLSPLPYRGRKRARSFTRNDRGESVSRLIKLSCPTRVFILQDDKAELLCSGAAIGEEVASVWHSVSCGSLPK